MPEAVSLPVWGYALLRAPSVAAVIMILRGFFNVSSQPRPRPSGCHPRHEMPMPPVEVVSAPLEVDRIAQEFTRRHQVRFFYVCGGVIVWARWSGSRSFDMDGLLQNFPSYNEEPF